MGLMIRLSVNKHFHFTLLETEISAPYEDHYLNDRTKTCLTSSNT
jgi:hypothetical protein